MLIPFQSIPNPYKYIFIRRRFRLINIVDNSDKQIGIDSKLQSQKLTDVKEEKKQNNELIQNDFCNERLRYFITFS